MIVECPVCEWPRERCGRWGLAISGWFSVVLAALLSVALADLQVASAAEPDTGDCAGGCGNGDDPRDTDADGKPDDIDDDDDGDDLCDVAEGSGFNPPRDTDGDGMPDFRDDDDDNDGIPTSAEGADPNGDCDPSDAVDSDGDLIPDYLDPYATDMTGGACTVGVGSGTWLWALFVLAALFRVSRRGSTICALVALGLGAAPLGTASAQQIALDQYQPPALSQDGLVLGTPAVLPHLHASGQVTLDYADDPLVTREHSFDGVTEGGAIVGVHVVAHLTGAVGFRDAGLFFIGLPLHLVMDGERSLNGAASDGAGVGDVYAGGRYRFVQGSHLSLSGQFSVSVPTASMSESEISFAGSFGATAHAQVLAQAKLGRARLTVNLGTYVRDGQKFDNFTIGSALTFGLGLIAPLIPDDGDIRVDGYIELHGSTGFANLFGADETPLAMLFGAKAHVASGLVLGAALGPGLQPGIGAPDLRLLGSIAWSGPIPWTGVGTRTDRDGDGVDNVDDQCPSRAEDMDGFQDEDGCPDPDNDQDGVSDSDDLAPLQPEDVDGFADHDGAPDLDNDEDGISDQLDECPDQPEDRDGRQDDDGCPEP